MANRHGGVGVREAGEGTVRFRDPLFDEKILAHLITLGDWMEGLARPDDPSPFGTRPCEYLVSALRSVSLCRSMDVRMGLAINRLLDAYTRKIAETTK